MRDGRSAHSRKRRQRRSLDARVLRRFDDLVLESSAGFADLLAEIGRVVGVGESRVSQLRSQAIARLRSTLGEWLVAPEARAS